ncbi:MAG TPA: hypothetical protein ENN73_01145 [Firmicutes bacterium]|nr:hypothetical protein [Bacillota bacterium]
MRELFKPKFSQNTKYAYSVGRIRGLELRLLNSQQIERLVEADTVNEFINELNETSYKKYIQYLSHNTDFEIVLMKILSDFMTELEALCNDPDIYSALCFPFDIHNLKFTLKRYLSGEDYAGIHYIKLGNYSPELFEMLLKEKQYNDFPDDLRAAVVEVVNEYSSSQNINIVDLVLDKILYPYWIVVGKGLGIEYLVNLSRLSIDIANFGMILRMKGFDRNPRILRLALIDGGFFPRDYLIGLFENDFISIIQMLNDDPYRKLFNGIDDRMQVIDIIEAYETNSRQLIHEYCSLANYVSFGVEPIIALYIKKSEELRILRTIYLGRKNNFSKDQIKKLI